MQPYSSANAALGSQKRSLSGPLFNTAAAVDCSLFILSGEGKGDGKAVLQPRKGVARNARRRRYTIELYTAWTDLDS